MRNMLIAAVCVTSLLFWLAVQYYVRPTQHWKARVFGEDPYDSFYGDARALSDEELQSLATDLQENEESSAKMTKVWAALWERGVGRNRFKGTGGGDDGGQQLQRGSAGRPPPPPPLDSCRRCAAFSATDFLPGAADAALAAQDPFWAVLQPGKAGAATAEARYHHRIIRHIQSPEYRVAWQRQPHPVPGLHGKTFDATSYSGKVFALALSEFKEVLMVDADSLPLLDPNTLFEDPRFQAHGSLFWPDAWTGQASRGIMEVYGIDAEKAERVLAMGRGTGRRDAESGQLLLDRSRHLDVIEALLFLNRHPSSNAGLLWGDKDTFWLAAALVGKAHCYNQVAVPPCEC
eukprot:XP_001700301.1 predicted protein [Chlamydomonas reinhardtii]